jgi:hypothetical protein
MALFYGPIYIYTYIYIYTHVYIYIYIIYIYIYVNSPLNHGFYEDKPQEEVAGGGVGLGRSGWVGRRREVCPGLSIPRNRQDGRTRNRWCIPKVAPTRGVHRLYVTEPPPEVGIGWDGMGSCGR